MKILIKIFTISVILIVINPIIIFQSCVLVGQSNHSLLFDGQSNYVEFPFADNHDLFEDFSIEMWIKFDSIPNGRILSKVNWGNPGDSTSSYSIYFEDSAPYKLIFSTLVGEYPSVEHKLISTIPIIYNRWNYIAVTYAEANYVKKIYINGVLSIEQDNIGNILYNGRPLFFGAFKTNQGDVIFPFAGNIDEVRIWNKELTIEEILYNMNNSVSGNENDLVALWHFNEGSGDTIYDSSIYNISGIINGANWDDGYNNDGAYGSTMLVSDVSAGSQILDVMSIEGFSIGDDIILNLGGENEETNSITGFGSILLNTPLQFDHSVGEMIINLIPTIVNESKWFGPKVYTLNQNFPNPFNPITSIKYQIPEPELVTIKVYDILGNEVVTLVNEEKPAGTYELTWNAANLPSGVYFYQQKAGDFIETKKMILMK